MSNQFTAPAKIIILGEHAVVYGVPAIAVPVSARNAVVNVEKSNSGNFEIFAFDLNAQLNLWESQHPLSHLATLIFDHFNVPPPQLRLNITSNIPVASGLGSGAAVSAAVGRALISSIGEQNDNDLLNSFVYQIEKFYHGTPSGIDNTVIVYEKPIKFTKYPYPQIIQLEITKPLNFIIADTGVKALTHESVADVKKLYEINSVGTQTIFDEITHIVQDAIISIESGDIETLGKLMNRNHTLLQQLTVSSTQLDNLVEVARQAGAIGAKLSGGGRGGNLIALVKTENLEKVHEALSISGATNVIDFTLNPNKRDTDDNIN